MPTQDPAGLLDLYRYRSRNGLIVCEQARHARYPVHPAFRPVWGCLSIVAVRNGCEEYDLVDTTRTLVVDDDVYLVLDGATRYGYRLRSNGSARCLMVSFPPSLLESVATRMTNDLERGVEGESPFLDGRPPFLERLKAHDDLVSPELLRIERACQEGVVDAEWYAQQTAVLLHRVLAFEESEVRQLRGTRSLRATTKRELARRVALVTDYIHANYRHRLDLRTLAAEAGLSPYHLLRVFHAICGVTPQEFLQRKRVTVARRLLANTGLSATRVASLVGFRSRSSLYRWMRRV